TARPSSAPGLGSLMGSPAEAMTSLTRLPEFVAGSSLMAVSVMLPVLSTGASLTATTRLIVIAAVSVARLKAVRPALLVTSAVRPLDPLVRSQARNVIPSLTVPLKWRFGTKRTRVLPLLASSRAEEADGLPKGVQLPPPSVLNSQRPLLLLTAVTAIP